METQRFRERILETENLTDELEDADANWLLEWGLARLEILLQDITEEEAAGEKTNQLMAAMRKLNRIAGSYTRKDAPSLAEDLSDLHELIRAAFGPENTQPAFGDSASFEAAASRLSELTPRQVLETLTQPPTLSPGETNDQSRQ